MGKRELVIVLAFVLLGTVAYHFTAPPDTGSSSFSLGNFFQSARREIRGNPGQGSYVHTKSLPAPGGLHELRLIGTITSVEIVGDDRDTIDYEFTVNSTGPDDAGAVELAKQTELIPDDLGDVLVLRVKYPEPATQRASIVVHVPRRLAVRLEGSRDIKVSHVAGVHLESTRGDVTLTDITGAITGAQQDGDFAVTTAESVKVRLTRSRSQFAGVTGGLALDLRDGDASIKESGGDLEIDETRAEITVDAHRGTIVVRGADGRITLRQPTAETRVDVRRAEVELQIAQGIPATILTTDEPLRLVLVGTPSFDLDAAATNGDIQATEFNLTPDTPAPSARLTHSFGGRSDTRVTLRNTRGNIVIRKSS